MAILSVYFLFIFLGKRFLHIANVGDARAVISHKGQAHRLTYDHKATDEREQKRIEEAGGFVLRGRVLGILAVARSFGDHSLKQFVSARPHITITEITADHDFVALCCDGVFDVMEDDDVINFIKENSQKGGLGNFLYDCFVMPSMYFHLASFWCHAGLNLSLNL